MQKNSDIGRALSLVGSCFFLVIAAALIYSQYAEDPSTTKVAVSAILAGLSAFLVPVGWCVRAANRKQKLNRRQSLSAKARPRPTVKSRRETLLVS